MKRVLFLSYQCGHCRRIINSYSDLLLGSDIEQIFVGTEEFFQKYKKVRNFLRFNHPELALHEYVVPLLAFFDEKENVVDVLPGYILVSNYLDSVKEKIFKNNV